MVSLSDLSLPGTHCINKSGLHFTCRELIVCALNFWSSCFSRAEVTDVSWPCPVDAVLKVKPGASCLVNKHHAKTSYISLFFFQHIPPLALVFLGKSDTITLDEIWKIERRSPTLLTVLLCPFGMFLCQPFSCDYF